MNIENRLPYQILVFPFRLLNDKIEYALFKREDLNVWQGIAGGGEKGENPLITAKRETKEEANIKLSADYIELLSMTTIPVTKVCGFNWGDDIFVVPEFSFGVNATEEVIKLSGEHKKCNWFTFKEAMEKLNWDSNKTALWELDYRIKHQKISCKKNHDLIKKFLCK